jgi:hydroxymethylglutaryl-CoA synthase
LGGITGYGAYLPYHRLERSAISAALGQPAGRGARSVASYDEDATSMAVEAARVALRRQEGAREQLEAVVLSTVSPPYLDKTNATAVHAALDLDPSVRATDRNGSVRAAFVSFLDELAAADGRSVLALASDIRTGLPGGADEREGGDGAVAFLVGPGRPGAPVLAEPLGWASATGEFLDRWRTPGEVHSQVWEERFGEFAYLPLADAAFSAALKRAGATPADLDHLVVAGPHSRAVRSFASGSGARREALADDLTGAVGNLGAAHFGLVLASVLDRAEPGQLVGVVSVADGADALVLRTTAELPAYRRRGGFDATVEAAVASGRPGLSYTQFLTWREMLRREPPRRPDPDRPAAPPSLRSEEWKFAFVGSRCTARVGGAECGMRHLPPQRVCARCHAVDQMAPQPFADARATVATFTVDRLAYSPSPPIVAAVLDFDGGGRFRCELTDVDADKVAIGDRVEMTFRRLYTAKGVHDYFWKARPVRTAGERKEA